MAVGMVRHYLQKGTHKGLYRNIARTLKFFQTFALLEVRSAAFVIYNHALYFTPILQYNFVYWLMDTTLKENKNLLL